MFNSTTEAFATEHSAPLTIAVDAEIVDPSAPQAALIGIVGAGDGVVGVDDPPPPPQAATRIDATATRRFPMINP
jgi:hypothetical protein